MSGVINCWNTVFLIIWFEIKHNKLKSLNNLFEIIIEIPAILKQWKENKTGNVNSDANFRCVKKPLLTQMVDLLPKVVE